MMRLRRLWLGEVPLADAFWNWAVLGGLAVNGATNLSFFVLISTDRPIAALLVGHTLPLPYNVLVVVGVWRAAERYAGPRSLAHLARIVTVVGMVLLSVA